MRQKPIYRELVIYVKGFKASRKLWCKLSEGKGFRKKKKPLIKVRGKKMVGGGGFEPPKA